MRNPMFGATVCVRYEGFGCVVLALVTLVVYVALVDVQMRYG